MLNALGSGARRLKLWVKDLESLQAGAFRQLTTGRMGWSGLCSLIKPFMVGVEGLRLMNFHLELGTHFCTVHSNYLRSLGMSSPVLLGQSTFNGHPLLYHIYVHLLQYPSSVHLPSYSHQVFTTDIPHFWPLRQLMSVSHPAICMALSLLTLGYTPLHPPHSPMYLCSTFGRTRSRSSNDPYLYHQPPKLKLPSKIPES